MDLTRSLSRAGRQPTGIDRVELAYLDHLLHDDIPLFGLLRTGAGYLLLDREGLSAAQTRLHGTEPWGEADLLSSMFRKRPEMVRRAESDLRALAIGRCRPRGLAQMLRRHLPAGAGYINTGHAGLTLRALGAIRNGTGGPIAVLVHDTIPLDHPDYQRPGTVERFRRKLAAVEEMADLVICNSRFTETRLRETLAHCPETIVAPLGVTPAQPDPLLLPEGLPPARPYFVTVGTIEPRKGHDLLLDVWDSLCATRPGEEIPGLLICGARGWNNAEVFARLDALPPDGPVKELRGLPDGAIAALLQGSCGLLFPSHAEGYGLPPLEAASLGVPVVLRDLPVYRETLGNIPVYQNETDCYLWRNIVDQLSAVKQGHDRNSKVPRFAAPGWSDHFDVVGNRI